MPLRWGLEPRLPPGGCGQRCSPLEVPGVAGTGLHARPPHAASMSTLAPTGSCTAGAPGVPSGFAGNGDTLEAPPCPWEGGRGQQMEQCTVVNVLSTAPRPTPGTPFCAVKRGTEGDTPGGHHVSTLQQGPGAQGHCLLAKPKTAREEEKH